MEWSVLDTISKVSEVLECFYDLLIQVIDKHASLKEKRVKRDKQPECMTDDILQSMIQWDHFKQTGHEESYKLARNQTVDLINNAKTENYSTVINESKGNSSKLYTHLADIAPKDCKQLPSSI